MKKFSILFLLLTFNSLIFPLPVYAVDLGPAYGWAKISSAGYLLGIHLVPVVFEIAGIAVLFYTVFAAIKYMTSGGDKEAVAAARNMITHSIIGFILLIFVFLFLQYIFPAIGLEGFAIIR